MTRLPLMISLLLHACAPATEPPSSTLAVDRAAVTPSMTLRATTRIVPGELATLEITGGPANRSVFLLGSLRPTGSLACPQQLAPACLDLSNPVSLAGQSSTDASGDAWFTVPVPAAAPVGLDGFLQVATRVGATTFVSNVLEVTFQPAVPTASVSDIRSGLVVAQGERVTAEDLIVTAVGPSGFTAEDGTGATRSGIYVYTNGASLPSVGDLVTVTAEYLEYSGVGGTPPLQTLSELVATPGTPGASITVTGSAPLPIPLVVRIHDLDIPVVADDYESRAVTLYEPPPALLEVLTNGSTTFDEFLVGTVGTSDTAVIDNEFYSLPNNLLGFGVGGTFEQITGVVTYTFGATKIAPRSFADVQGYVPPPADTDTDLDTDPPVPPAVWITEVVDYAPLSGLKYVEIVNRTGATYDLSNLAVLRYANGGTNPAAVALGGVVAAGDVFVLGATTTSNYLGIFGDVPDQTHGAISGNGNDVYALAVRDGLGNYVVFDTYGVIGVDGTGEIWEYTDSVATRSCGATAPSSTFAPSDWTISTDFVAQASLGVPPACP